MTCIWCDGENSHPEVYYLFCSDECHLAYIDHRSCIEYPERCTHEDAGARHE